MEDVSGRDDAELTALADVAREYGHHLGRTRFAGVGVDREQRVLTVYRVPDPGFDSELRTLLAGDITIRLVDAPHPGPSCSSRASGSGRWPGTCPSPRSPSRWTGPGSS